MDFDFSDDQEQLRDAVRKWVDKGYDFERRRTTVAAGGFDRAAYNELAELGLTGLYVPEGDGGMGMGPVEGMVVMEELGRGIVLEPLTQTLIAGGVLSGYARRRRSRPQWLPKIASGEALVVLAYQERKARYQLDICEAKATQSSAGWSLICYQKHGAGGRPGRCLHRARHGRRQDRAVPGRAQRQPASPRAATARRTAPRRRSAARRTRRPA